MFSTTLNGASGELPDLILFLQSVYRKEAGIPAGLSDPSDSFIEWARSYLDKHRPSEVFAVDNNYGVQLTDGQRLQICPSLGATSNGDMANSDNSVSIMRAR